MEGRGGRGRGKEGREREGKGGERRGCLCWPNHFSKVDNGSVTEAEIVTFFFVSLYKHFITQNTFYNSLFLNILTYSYTSDHTFCFVCQR